MFEQVNGSKFKVVYSQAILTEVDAIIKSISSEDNEYAEVLTNDLRNSIISRIVSKYFLKEKKEVFKKYQYITIDIQTGIELVICTLGFLPKDDKGEMVINGVLVV